MNDCEQPSLTVKIRRGEYSSHPFQRFISKDERGVSLEQAPKSESRGILNDVVMRKLKVEIEIVLVKLELYVSRLQ